jgi:hypothetical protein
VPSDFFKSAEAADPTYAYFWSERILYSNLVEMTDKRSHLQCIATLAFTN